MGLFDKLLGNATLVSPSEMQAKLAKILIENEEIQGAFSFIRDEIVFTNKRLIFIDKQGITGKKTEWKTVPYHKITCFSAETAGTLDTDAELKIWVGSQPEPIKIKLSKTIPLEQLYKILSFYTL